MARHIGDCAFWLTVLCLLCANLSMLLPWTATVFLLVPQVMGPPLLQMDLINDDAQRIVVFDGVGDLFYDRGTNVVWPLPILQSRLDQWRVSHLVHTSSISLWVQPADDDEFCAGTWTATETWRPVPPFPIRFELPAVINLEPGPYTMRAVIEPDPTWNYNNRWPLGSGRSLSRPVLPGQFMMRTTHTASIEMVVVE